MYEVALECGVCPYTLLGWSTLLACMSINYERQTLAVLRVGLCGSGDVIKVFDSNFEKMGTVA